MAVRMTQAWPEMGALAVGCDAARHFPDASAWCSGGMASAPRTPVAGRRAARTRRLGLAASVGVHLVLALVLLAALGASPAYLPQLDPPTIAISLAPPPAREPPPQPPGGAAPQPAPASALPSPKIRLARTLPPQVAPLVAATSPEPAPMPSLSAAEVAGARTAGSGGGDGGGSGAGDGGCDMVRRIEGALRKDPEVRAAAAGAHRAVGGGGRAVVVWNGDWVLSPGQSGKGLAGVRQAIALEVAFAPEACRAEPMRGLVVLALAEGAEAPRLALGAGQWRWTDLLGARRR